LSACNLEIVNFQKNHLGEVLKLIVEAFNETELYHFIAPNEKERLQFLERIFLYRASVGVAYGESKIALLNEKIVAAAIWTPSINSSQAYESAKAEQERLGKPEDFLAAFSETIKKRWFDFFTLFQTARDKIITQPYWALTPIAVSPNYQGRGFASALLQKKFKELDEYNLPLFLGCQEDTSKDIYLHYGFKILRQDKIPGSKLSSWSMVRNPIKTN